VRVQWVDRLGVGSAVRQCSDGGFRDIKRKESGWARCDGQLCSSLNALHVVAVADLANKPIGGIIRAESEQSDLVLLQIKGTR